MPQAKSADAKADDSKNDKSQSVDHMPWEAGTWDAVFQSQPKLINASLPKVFALIKSVDRYSEFSDHQIDASIDGKVEIGNTLHVSTNTGAWIEKCLPKSDETITELKETESYAAISWDRDVGCKSYSRRSTVLVSTPDGKTNVYVALRVPGFSGFFTKMTMPNIPTAFDKFLNGIDKVATAECGDEKVPRM